MAGSFEDYYRRLYVPPVEVFEKIPKGCISANEQVLSVFPLSLDEFEELYDSELLWEWDEKYGLILDEYEDGAITEDLESIAEETKRRLGDGAVSRAFALAAEWGTAVYLYL